MITRTYAHAAIAYCLLLLGPPSLHAQWTLRGGIRAPRFSGGAFEPTTGRSLSPYRPTMFEIGVERGGHRVGVGLGLEYASSSLALEGEDALAAVKDALTVYGAEPEVSIRLAHIGREGMLRLYAGPLIEVWDLPDEGSRTRIGMSAAVGLEVPLGGRWSGAVRAGAAVTPSSPFTQEDLGPTFEPRALWRREIDGTLRYRL